MMTRHCVIPGVAVFMKSYPSTRTILRNLAFSVAFTILFAPSPQLEAQGDLTPSGAPAPTMKTLDQLEPRTPISASTTPGDDNSQFKITQPGSYYLTGNLAGVAEKHGIEIVSSDVTLDLMGFRMRGRTISVGNDGPSRTGVLVPGTQSNICIRNGIITNWSVAGVYATAASNSVLHQLRVSDCGTNGLVIGASSLVKDCIAQSNMSTGFEIGNGSVIKDCVANANGHLGIFAASKSIISGCTASDNGDDGIRASTNSKVTGCTATSNTGDGIEIPSACLVRSNTCNSNGANAGNGAGIHATGSRNRIDGNNVTDNDRGLDVDAGGNLIVRNSATGNGANYSQIVSGNTRGEVVDTSASGGTLNETHGPWANFSF